MEDEKHTQDQTRFEDVSAAEILRRTRLGYGKTLTDIERVLRIRESQIDAIEKGEVYKLPGRVYAIGFVRSYAEYLGLDGGKIVQLYKAQHLDGSMNEKAGFSIPASESKTPPVWIALMVAALGIIAFAGWTQYQVHNRDIVTVVPPVPEEIKSHIAKTTVVDFPEVSIPSNIPRQAVSDVVASGEGASEKETPVKTDQGKTAQQKKDGVTLNIVQNSWVEIKDNKGKVIVSNVLKTGDQYFVPDSPDLTMSLGNAGGVEIVLNGRVMKPLGKSGDIRRDIPLNTEYLKTLEFKEEEKEIPVPPPAAPENEGNTVIKTEKKQEATDTQR